MLQARDPEVPEKVMTAFEQSSIQPRDTGLTNKIIDKLRRLVPAAAAMSYPFRLDAFRLFTRVEHPAFVASGISSARRRLQDGQAC
jgi:hypothetical protein